MVVTDSQPALESDRRRVDKTAVKPNQTSRQVRSCKVCRLRKVKVRTTKYYYTWIYLDLERLRWVETISALYGVHSKHLNDPRYSVIA